MRHRRLYTYLLFLSFPLLASLLIQPIVGLIDTKMLGSKSDSVWLAGLTMAAALFTQMIWLFAFLFQSTLSHTAQAAGRKNTDNVRQILHRSLILALICAGFIIITHPIIFYFAFRFINPPAEVKDTALVYLNIRVYFIVFSLVNFVSSAWLLALGKTKAILYYDIVFAGLTVLFNVIFVIILDYNIKGIAIGTVLAEACAFLLILFMLKANNAQLFLLLHKAHAAILLQKDKILPLLVMNRDAFMRTLCLLSSLLLFNKLSSSFGSKDVIAANGVMTSLIMLIATFLEAFAHAASSLVGKAYGKGNMALVKIIAMITFRICILLAVVLSIILYFNYALIVGFLAKPPEILALIARYNIWFLIFPTILIISFVYDSLFIGMGDLKTLRNGALLGLLCFIALSFITKPLGIHGLWLAFLSVYVMRATYSHYYFKRKVR